MAAPLGDESAYTGDRSDRATMNVWLHRALTEMGKFPPNCSTKNGDTDRPMVERSCEKIPDGRT